MNILIILFGGIFLVLGIIIAIRLCYLKKVCTIETEATVIKIARTNKRGAFHYEYIGDKKVFKTKGYTPIFQYYVNEEVIIKKSLYSTYSKFKVGDKVRLFYNPDNIETYYVVEHAFTGIPFILFGILFIFLGTYY